MLTKMTGDKEEYMGMAYRAARKKKEALWPTPDAKGFTSSGSLGMLAQKADDRDEFLAMGTRAAMSRKEAVWPTPSVNDGHCGTGPSQFQRHTPGLPVAVLKKEPDGKDAEVRRLNPDWVEWLMGWPVGWTSLSSVNMEYYDNWLRQAEAGTWWDADPAETPHMGELIPRVSAGCPNRVSRISLLGNGQVPSTLKLFWNIITNFQEEVVA